MRTTAGIFTPQMEPPDEHGSINKAEPRRYVDGLIERGANGSDSDGSTGESIRFAPDERCQVIPVVCSQMAGHAPTLAGALEANVRKAIAAGEANAGDSAYGGDRIAILEPAQSSRVESAAQIVSR